MSTSGINDIPSTMHASAIPEGFNRVRFYWNGESGLPDESQRNTNHSDMWIWWAGFSGGGFRFEACPYGVACTVDVPLHITEIGFIVRTGCSEPCGMSWGVADKDFGSDRFAFIAGRETEIYLVAGDGGQYSSADGGKTLVPIKVFTMASIVSENSIEFHVRPDVLISSLDQIKVWLGDEEAAVRSLSCLGRSAGDGIVTLHSALDAGKQCRIELPGYGSKAAIPIGLFDSEAFIRDYSYQGDDLGVTLTQDGADFRLWAPTASEVALNLFKAGNGVDAYAALPMKKEDHGVWHAFARCGSGTYYTYTVTSAIGVFEVVDPYARSAGLNGKRAMVLDMKSTDPAGFSDDRFVQCRSYSDAIIWEVHVRDFSNHLAASAYRGKYLAFTESGLTGAGGEPAGLDHIVSLGITHVQLQPVFDYNTVDENSPLQFNWGYDPQNFNVPEGSYSTDPFNGEVRVRELKQLVQSLHSRGIGVIMDVVYNHTYDIFSNLQKIVPYYYYRYTDAGTPSGGSGCGNETASERLMFRKFMIDSILYWQREYHIDGFRFDLMALHDMETMQMIERAIHKVNPSALLYGEGWTGGATTLEAARQSSKANIKAIKPSANAAGSVAVFNDVMRDGLKGEVFNPGSQGYINGNADGANASRVCFGITGGAGSAGGIGGVGGAGSRIGWSVDGGMVVNYMSAHDNNTLWDKLCASAGRVSEHERIAMNRLGASIVFISRGMPFMLAGEEMLRTKKGDDNSYKSPDDVNNIDWDALAPSSPQSRMANFYRKLIAMRKAFKMFRNSEVRCRTFGSNAIEVSYERDGMLAGLAVINPGNDILRYNLNPNHSYKLVALGDYFPMGAHGIQGEASIPGRSVIVVSVC